MNNEQEDLIATGIWLLIKSSDKLKSSEKEVWMKSYKKEQRSRKMAISV